MGSMLSGHRESKKRVVESCTTIDTADLKRLRLLVPGITNRTGSLNWKREGEDEPSSSVGYTITVWDESGSLRVRYQVGQPPVSFDYQVPLVGTRRQLGGVRWWLICPLNVRGVACRRRVRKLYLCGKYFGCRQCHNLTYTSSQESDSRVYAALRGKTYLDGMSDPSTMSVAQLGFTLKMLTLEKKRLDRLSKREKTKIACRDWLKRNQLGGMQHDDSCQE